MSRMAGHRESHEGRRLGWVWWAVSGFAAALLVSLTVGWILVWANFDGGPRAVMISLGSVAFTLVLVALALLLVRLRSERRLRVAEARFLTGASHNLRTPLASILTAAQALASDALVEADRRQLLSVVRQEARLLALRVDNLIESGRRHLEGPAGLGDLVDLVRVAEGVVRGVRERVEARGGSIELRSPSACPVEGDERMLRLVLENLVDNAIRFSEGAPHVAVEVAPAGRKAVASVSDQGIGFDPAEVSSFGDRFGAGDGERAGLRLGLGLSRSIAECHGGFLRLESPGRGRGARAELRLPLAGT